MVYSSRLEEYGADYVPEDKYNVLFLLVTLVGFGVLMPWNMFITIAPEYYVNYWFKPEGNATSYSNQFMSSLTISAQLPNAAINIINLFLVISGPLIYRVFAPVVFNIINITIVLALVIFTTPSLEAMGLFFWSTLFIVMLINISNGLYENSVFGVFADFPHKYTGALLIGNNACGLMITFMKIGVTLMMKEKVQLTAIIYFSISLVILILCGIALLIITKKEVYHYYHTKGIETRKVADTSKPSVAILWATFKQAFGQLFNVWLTFATTLCVFPVMMSATTRSGSGWIESILPQNEELFTLLTTFLVFNLFATIGALLASKYQWPEPRGLVYVVLLRLLIVPFMFFCNYRANERSFPVYFHSTDLFVIAGILLSISHGYLSSLAMSYCPKTVSPEYSRFSAQLSACTLMIGLFSGACFSFVIDYLIVA